MRKILSIAVFLSCLTLSASLFAATQNMYINKTIIYTLYPSNTVNSTDYMMAGNPDNYRGFAEFNLQAWYDKADELSLNETSIISVIFDTPGGGTANTPVIGLYAMGENETGTISGTNPYNTPLLAINTSINKATIQSGIYQNITSFFVADITNEQQYTGYAIRNQSGIVNGAWFTDAVLRITYDDTPVVQEIPVPEPASVMLLSAAVLGVIKRLRK
ncbi:MAG: PEP-CTERM sorting domain-containing protein [Candidatus Auribacter fodinae]|uniref:PEP-CTERM sorting domain-containing protein n=1 Tax=Candidatus Auribacter fodinae TaxID=2093366 RepID=A0A3A4QZD8_9BACT|nr:MAG: PEP-CTERM sorting domain-containing protein [Candidatus Auribacter fodinae]